MDVYDSEEEAFLDPKLKKDPRILDFSNPGKPKILNDYNSWKEAQGALVVAPERVWDYQAKIIREKEAALIIAGDTLKKSQEILSKLKDMFEENLMAMSTLEMENMALKDKLNGQETNSR